MHLSALHIPNGNRTIGNQLKNSVFLTLSQAAKETGRSKSTIFKAIESGKLSYIEKTTAGYKIDPSELFRVFPIGGKTNVENTEIEQLKTMENTIENDFLRRENELLRQQIEREREQTDHWRRQATMLLTYQPEIKQEQKEPEQKVESLLLKKLFGRDRR